MKYKIRQIKIKSTNDAKMRPLCKEDGETSQHFTGNYAATGDLGEAK